MASDGFIREVDEELQRDRMAKLWKSYGPIAIGLLIVVVLGTAGKVGWDAWQLRQLEQQGAAFAAAEASLARNDPAVAADQFIRLAEAQRGNAAALAKLRAAEARMAAGDVEAGLALLEQLAAADRTDAVISDYAAVVAAQRRVGVDDAASLQVALAPRMSGNSPFRHSAREIVALAALLEGDEAGAIGELQQLEADLAAPDDMRRRAGELLAALRATERIADPVAPRDADAS